MKRLIGASVVAVLLLAPFLVQTNAAGRFDLKLSIDHQILHVLNRMTFGPRPGDVEQVRRIGIGPWIDLQMHPERITEDPALAAKLKSLTTLQLANWQLLQDYPATPAALNRRLPSQNALTALPPQQLSKLLNCSVQDRMDLLQSFDPGVRHLILTAASPAILDGLPAEMQQEATKAKQEERDENQKEIRRINPPLTDLVGPPMMRTVNSGTPEERRDFIASFDQEKREQLLRALPPQALKDLPDLNREALKLKQPQQFVNSELVENKLLRAVYSNRQLEEVLVDFWMNHFNVFNGKGPDRVLLTSFERDAIRPYVFGHFRDMLLATARHPAMLFYLDNWQSQVQRDDLPVQAGVRRPGLNENYGRELMELHTLGVNGGYSQDDVISVARAFSGWTIYDPQKFGEFQFNPGVHDRKEKTVLGHTIPAMGGEQDAARVIDILARHPSTAKFISRELAQRFVADDPPQALVDHMADTFMKTDGDLRAVMQTMFSSVEFLSEGAWQSKLKSPLEMAVSALRALKADITDTFALAQRIADLGEPLYGKLEPTGYPNTGEGWSNTAGLLGRINFASALVSSQIIGVKVDVSRFNFKEPSLVATDLLGTPPAPSMLTSIQKGLEGKEVTPSILTSLVISSPDFQKR